jgi:hypothetical protein
MLRKFACLLTVAIALSCVARAQAQLPNGAANREATLNYLKQVMGILERESAKITRDSPLEEDAKVYRSMARQIRSIPTRGVDSEVLECALKMANFFDRKARLCDEAAELTSPGNMFVQLGLPLLIDLLIFEEPVITPFGIGTAAQRFQRLEQEDRQLQRDWERLEDRWVEVLTRLARTYNFD